MTDDTQAYKDQADKMVAEICSADPTQRVLDLLREKDPDLRDLTAAMVRREVRAWQLALGAIYWTYACEEKGQKDEEIQKAFLRSVMKRFDSTERLEEASRFSAYLTSDGQEESPAMPVVALARTLYEEFLAELDHEIPQSAEITPGLKALVDLGEAFRSRFLTQLEEFSA